MSYVARSNGMVGSFADDAKKAMTENPDYFTFWYTTKSLALVASVAYIAYLLGKSSRRRQG